MDLTYLLSARGWFAGFLVIMIIITLLFALIVFIALKPIKKEDVGADITDAKNLLGRREAELTKELLANKGDKAKTEELMGKLREIALAEKIVNEILDENKAAAAAADEQEKQEKLAKGAKKAEQHKPKTTASTDVKAEKAEKEVAVTDSSDKKEETNK